MNLKQFQKLDINLDVGKTQSISTATSEAINKYSTDGVADEYALYDYKNHSYFYMIKRRFKLLFSSLFTKLPKVFGKETNTENN